MCPTWQVLFCFFVNGFLAITAYACALLTESWRPAHWVAFLRYFEVELTEHSDPKYNRWPASPEHQQRRSRSLPRLNTCDFRSQLLSGVMVKPQDMQHTPNQARSECYKICADNWSFSGVLSVLSILYKYDEIMMNMIWSPKFDLNDV